MCVTTFLHMFVFKYWLKKQETKHSSKQRSTPRNMSINTEYMQKTNSILNDPDQNLDITSLRENKGKRKSLQNRDQHILFLKLPYLSHPFIK